MITIRDLQEAITECEKERNPNANTCIKLAAYYTILDHMSEDTYKYSYSAPLIAPTQDKHIKFNSDSEFAQTINGKRPEDVYNVLDELMNTLQVLNPRLYNGVMNKLST